MDENDVPVAPPVEVTPPEAVEARPPEDAPGAGIEQEAEKPESLDALSFPDDFEVDQANLSEFKDWAGRNKVGTGEAQALIDLFIRSQDGQHQRNLEAQRAEVQGWEEKARADQDLGGPDFERKLAVAQTAIDRFGDKELRDFLDFSGIGSHPAVVRWMLRVGEATADDRFIPPGRASGPLSPEARARRLYDNTYKD